MGSRSSALALGALLLAGVSSPAQAQAACAGTGEPVQMRMFLEKTIFHVDVLWLTLQVWGETAEHLRDLSRRPTRSEAVVDSVARTAIEARCAVSQFDFVRDISRDRFLDALRESTRKAWEGGLLDEETYRYIQDASTEWYPFLRDRGVRKGDRMTYRIRGDSLTIQYRARDGELLLDQLDVNRERARSVLAGYFAPGSDFRDGLVRSLFTQDDDDAAAEVRARQGGRH